MEIKENIVLAPYTTYKIGGEARYFTTCSTKEDFLDAINFAKNKKIKFFIIGGGSNVIFQDLGFSGLVILNRFNEITFHKNQAICGSGAILSLLIRKALEQKLGGLENLFGIPGTIGGAIYQNAGAYGKEIGEFIHESEIIDETGEIIKVRKDYFKFAYRDSILKKNKNIVLTVTLNLKKITDYEIIESLDKITEVRSKTKPYGKSCGSFFKNPSSDLSAGKLIEAVGLKGFRIGDAVISQEHANYLINQKNSTAEDLLKLAQKIKETVFKEKGIKLEEEVQIINY